MLNYNGYACVWWASGLDFQWHLLADIASTHKSHRRDVSMNSEGKFATSCFGRRFSAKECAANHTAHDRWNGNKQMVHVKTRVASILVRVPLELEALMAEPSTSSA
jgi:hypothetical protein